MHAPKSVWNTVAVIVVALWALCTTLPDFLLPWHSYAQYSLGTDNDGIVTAVIPNSDASRAGVIAGDRIDLRALTLEDRLYFFSNPPPGKTVEIPVIHGTTSKMVHLTAITRSRSLAENISNEILMLATAASILIGATLVFLRPGLLTWSFFLIILDPKQYEAGYLEMLLPATGLLIEGVLVALAAAAGFAGLISFSARFPNDDPPRWRDRLSRRVWLLFPAFALISVMFIDGTLLGFQTQSWVNTFIALTMLVYAGAVAVFIQCYRHSSAEDRARMKWVIAAVGIAGVAMTVEWVAELILNFPVPLDVLNLVYASPVLISIAVAYVLLKQRVVDVNFAISRALVYAVLTAIIVAAFGAIDLLVTRFIVAAQWAIPLEVLAAIGLGFWLNALEKRVDRLVDGVLFKQRHQAELQLHRVALTLPHASDFSVADAFVTEAPAHALDLQSAAVFRRREDGSFERKAALGWGAADLNGFLATDSLVLQLVATEAAIRLRDVILGHANLPDGAARPIIALPINARHQLRGIALYGAHVSGTDIDDDEERSLSEIAAAAATAYDHIEAEALRAQVGNLRRALEALQTQLEASERSED